MKPLNLRKASFIALFLVPQLAQIDGAKADGIPQKNALSYTGVLENADGTPLTGDHRIEIKLWTSVERTGSAPCTTNPQQVELINGRFSLTLPDDCVEVVKSHSDVWVEVLDNSVSLGAAAVGATPYAVEAGRSSEASRATSAESLAGTPADQFQRRIQGWCADGSNVRAIAPDGNITCQPDSDTRYSAGAGISVESDMISVDPEYVQRRLEMQCPEGSLLRGVAQDGTVTCAKDNDTSYQAGNGLSLDGTTFSIKQFVVSVEMSATSNSATQQVVPLGQHVLCVLSGFDILHYNDPNTHRYCYVELSDSGWQVRARAAGSNELICRATCFR